MKALLEEEIAYPNYPSPTMFSKVVCCKTCQQLSAFLYRIPLSVNIKIYNQFIPEKMELNYMYFV